MTVQELTQAVNDRALYSMRDGSRVEVNQVHARTNNYKDVFEKDGSKVRLREESSVLDKLPDQITLFRDNDEQFFACLDEHPTGHSNCERTPRSSYLVLHQLAGSHFKAIVRTSTGPRTTSSSLRRLPLSEGPRETSPSRRWWGAASGDRT
jgi:hypothetical protein